MSLFGGGIGGNTRSTTTDTDIENYNLSNQVQTGSVNNVVTPTNLNLAGIGTGKKSNTNLTLNLQTTDYGAIQSAAEQAMLATAANASVSSNAIGAVGDIAGGAIYAANELAKELYGDSIEFAQFTQLGSQRALDSAGNIVEMSLVNTRDTNRQAFEFAGANSDAAFNLSNQVQMNSQLLARDSLQKSFEVAKDALTEVRLNSEKTAAELSSATSRALQFVDDYTRSDTADSYNNLIKYSMMAVGLIAAAMVFKVGK